MGLKERMADVRFEKVAPGTKQATWNPPPPKPTKDDDDLPPSKDDAPDDDGDRDNGDVYEE